MKPFTSLHGIAAPLPLANIDTDAIMPKQFLKTVQRTGLGNFLFWNARYLGDGAECSDFVLNREPYRQASILISGANFGCGSSREHAPWGLLDFGIRCVIASSFADIFADNCAKNGILCVALPSSEVETLLSLAGSPDTARLTVDLERKVIACGNGTEISFDIDPARRETLLAGLDDIALTLRRVGEIEAFETSRATGWPWWSTTEQSR